jgi:histidinol phosphatase-like PHP family hydrolase
VAGFPSRQNGIFTISYHSFSPFLLDFTLIDSIFYTKIGGFSQLTVIKNNFFKTFQLVRSKLTFFVLLTLILSHLTHPYRLDIHWRLCKYAKEKGVKIAIYPDAPKEEGLKDTYCGARIGRKGWLGPETSLVPWILER